MKKLRDLKITKRQLLCYVVSIISALILLFFWVYKNAEEYRYEQDKQAILQKHVEEKGYLIYGANISAPPLRFLDEDGIYKGVVVDYMSQLSLELGVEIKAEPYGWETALQKLRDGETDFCDMFENAVRAKDYVFTDPIYNLRTVLAVNAASEFSFDDISSMRIATEKGDYANFYMQEAFPEAELVYVNNISEGIDVLLRGEVDAVIGDEPVVSYYVKEKNTEIRMINTALYEKPVVIAMPKKNADLIPIINKAIQEVNQRGQLEKIQQKWFGISTPLIQADSPQKYLKISALIAGGLLIMIAMISINNRSLKNQVSIRTRELEESKNELQLIFDSIPEYILVVDKYGNTTNANKGIFAYTGLGIDHCIGMPCSIVLDKFSLDYDMISETKEGDSKERNLIKTGKDIYEVNTYPLMGLEQGTLVIFRNVTLDEINKKQLLQSSKIMAIGQLAAGMAHQIRNPLSVIRMQTYLLRENQNLDELGKKSLKYIDENVQKAGRTIDNVMNFWRVSGNKREQIDLYKSFEDIIYLHENLLKKKEIKVEILCAENLYFFCNEEALKHILVNLVSNAIDAMTMHDSLTLEGLREKDSVIIRCRDTGCGIAEADMENLFNPFFTTKEPGKGTGLGLFVVYSEIENLSGNIKVDSKLGEGTCFTITLPAGEEV